MTMDDAQEELLQAAQALCGEFPLTRDFTAGSVAAALRTESGDVFTGICIDLACGLGFCAEAAAIAEMLKQRQTRIVAIVAVSDKGVILPPCGRCREMMAQVNPANLDADIILPGSRSVSLRELLPESYIEAKL